MIRFLFKTPQHKTFNHKPIYYNPEAEDLKRRVAQSAGTDANYSGNLQKGNLKEAWGRNTRIASSKKSSSIRLVIIIIGLSLLAFRLFYY